MTKTRPTPSSAPVHIPVMLNDVITALEATAGETYVDATFGAGGYTTAMINAAPGLHVIAFDRDPDARTRFDAMPDDLRAKITFIDSPFSMIGTVRDHAAHKNGVDAVVFDLGVSSPQIDTPERGFSFRTNGPLDMRMDPRGGPSAADLVNTSSETDLANLIYTFGEERKSRSIARAIVDERVSNGPITTTDALAAIIRRVVRTSPKDMTDPCTRTFQALRIAVNGELDELRAGIFAAVSVLKPNGRLIVVSFHSLEDRIVKQIFTDLSGRAPAPSRHTPGISLTTDASVLAPVLRLLTTRAIAASDTESRINPRSRSAKMRVAIRTDTPFIIPPTFDKKTRRVA